MANKVNIFVVGAAKSGTSWLHACLAEHRFASVPLTKETNFFSRNFGIGEKKYERLFDLSLNRQAFDISPSYMVDASAPMRMYRYNPNAKLIFILREPVERGYSHYCMHYRAKKISQSPSEAITAGSEYVEHGLYFSAISRYLKFFSKQDILIVLYDELKSDPRKVLRKICDFSSIEYQEVSFLDKILHSSRPPPRFDWLYNISKNMVFCIEKNRMLAVYMKKIRASFLSEIYHRLFSRGEFPKMNSDERKQIFRFFEDDLNRLQQLISQDLSSWSSKY